MPNSADMLWFKTQFQPQIEAAIAGTPLTVDFLTAIACQETGDVWPALRRRGLPVDRSPRAVRGRHARRRQGPIGVPDHQGGAARSAARRRDVRDRAPGAGRHGCAIPAYAGVAKRPTKFCHGFGIFQRDLQFFLDDPSTSCTGTTNASTAPSTIVSSGAKRGLRALDFEDRDSFPISSWRPWASPTTPATFKPAKGLKQGHFDGKRFYGEAIFDFLRLAHTVALPGAAPAILAPPRGPAVVAPPTPVTATGPRLAGGHARSRAAAATRAEDQHAARPTWSAICRMASRVRALTGPGERLHRGRNQPDRRAAARLCLGEVPGSRRRSQRHRSRRPAAERRRPPASSA